jgi:hypothetical protein
MISFYYNLWKFEVFQGITAHIPGFPKRPGGGGYYTMTWIPQNPPFSLFPSPSMISSIIALDIILLLIIVLGRMYLSLRLETVRLQREFEVASATRAYRSAEERLLFDEERGLRTEEDLFAMPRGVGMEERCIGQRMEMTHR